MLLYHGTSESVAKLALTQGLWPRNTIEEDGNWHHTVPSSDKHVYLTRAYAPYFAAQKTDNDERWGIVQVEVKDVDMYPDEDFLEQATRGMSPDAIAEVVESPAIAKEIAACKGMKQRTAWFRDNLKRFKHLWEVSVRKMGNAAHMGCIPRWAVKSIALFDPKSNPFVAGTCMDPSISIINYHICGDKYRMLTNWFFCNGDNRLMARLIAGNHLADDEMFDIPTGMSAAILKQCASATEQLSKRDGVEVIENEDFSRS